jgi:hypothetical protein
MPNRGILALTCLLMLALQQSAGADPPTYVVLSTPHAPGGVHPSYGYWPGRAAEVQTSAYAYGWFGAPPRRHWSRHFGYYRNYREWSGR